LNALTVGGIATDRIRTHWPEAWVAIAPVAPSSLSRRGEERHARELVELQATGLRLDDSTLVDNNPGLES
jgi:hypothetical protein